MSKYLELVEGSFNESHFNKQTSQYPYVAYSIKDGKVIYSIIPKEEEEIDPTEGFVDLGLSVMWASCDVGASSPEGEGTKYAWGSDSWDNIPLESDPVYINSDMELKELLRPRTPSPEQIQELFDNTTATDEVLNGVSGVRYTAANGNSIFVSNAKRWTNVEKWKVTLWNTTQAVHWSPNEGIIDNDLGEGLSTYKSDLLSFRGICSCLPQGDAILLNYGVSTDITANDTNTLYCFPKHWTSTEFVAPTTFSVEMYVSNQPDFVPVERGENVLEYYIYDKKDNSKILYLSSKEIANLRLKTLDDYIYVRFRTAATTTITPATWVVDSCLDNTVQFEPNVRKNIPANSSDNIYRLRYKDFEDYGLTIKWSGNSSLRVYVADVCSFTTSSTDPNLLLYTSIARRKSYEVSLETVESWGPKLDEDGYIYVRFNTTESGNVTFVTEKPVEEDLVTTTIE